MHGGCDPLNSGFEVRRNFDNATGDKVQASRDAFFCPRKTGIRNGVGVQACE